MTSIECISLLRAGIYLLKFSNRNTGTMCEICSKLSVRTPKWRRSCVLFFVNYKYILYIVLSVFTVNFKVGPEFCNLRNFGAWFSICRTDWLKHRFLNEKELRTQILWLGQIGKINYSKKDEIDKRSKLFL